MPRLERFVARRALLEVTVDMETAIVGAVRLSNAHSEHVGARAIDLVHVSSALILESELFLTTDARQAQLAKAEGLEVVSVIAAYLTAGHRTT